MTYTKRKRTFSSLTAKKENNRAARREEFRKTGVMKIYQPGTKTYVVKRTPKEEEAPTGEASRIKRRLWEKLTGQKITGTRVPYIKIHEENN